MKTILNNIKNNYWLIIGILLVGGIAGYFIGKSSHPDVSISSHQHIEQSENQIWTCSMHPQIKRDKPGQCPICGMDLIPLDTETGDDEDIDPNEIRMNQSAIKLAEIQTMKVRKDYSNKKLHLLGRFKPDERNIAELTARYGGRIEKLHVNFTGQNVRKGEQLATIYSPELVTAQKELLEAMTYKETNPAFYKAARNKLKLWNLTDQQIKAIEEEGEPQNYFEVLSPITGTVTERHVAVGDYVKEGNALFRVINLRNLWVMFEAYESDLPWLSTGDKVEFTVQSLPGKTYTGKVTYIDPFLDPQTRVVNVRVEVDNPRLELKPEMFVNGVITPKVSDNQKSLLIPKTSVLWTGKRAVVYVKVPDREKPSFLYREITLGPEVGEFYVVEDGLSEGEEIAVNGVFKIDAAAQLEGKPSMMNPEGGATSIGHDHGSMTGSGGDQAQHSDMEMDKDLAHDTFHVNGNCEMCKSTIEKAAKGIEGVEMADWNINSKQMHVSYNDDKVKLGEIHLAIADAGYDTEKEKASKEAYGNLPACCQYTRGVETAVQPNIEQETFKVSGNCSMCKDRIEEAALSLDGVNSASWSEETKLLEVSFNNDKVKLGKIHKAIAKAGHDTEKEMAPDEVYNDLPACCLYTRE